MTGLLLATLAASGVALVLTGGHGSGTTPRRRSRIGPRSRVEHWMSQAGLIDVSILQFVVVTTLVGTVAGLLAWAVFGGLLAPVGIAIAAASVPAASSRHRRHVRLAVAAESWPAMIEEIRVLAGAAGRSIPRALLDVGMRGPEELRPAFRSAQLEWNVTTDFERTAAVLKQHLASPTADVVCETLLVANELGAVDLDRRLAELAEDRRSDVFARRDARAKQAGVRFARRFVIVVPVGMAIAGMSLGDGRSAYQTTTGQILVAVAVGLVGCCWMWSGQMLRLPDERRVFS
jgi:tight adherence protein B